MYASGREKVCDFCFIDVLVLIWVQSKCKEEAISDLSSIKVSRLVI